jgi:hypothetical protein
LQHSPYSLSILPEARADGQEGVPQGLKPALQTNICGTAEQAAEKVPSETKGVPQGLKPHCKQNTCGTAEAVPLSKTEFLGKRQSQYLPDWVARRANAESLGLDAIAQTCFGARARVRERLSHWRYRA